MDKVMLHGLNICTSTTLSPDGRVGFLKFSFVKTKLDIAKEENNNLQNLRFCCCEIEVSSCEKNRSLLLALKKRIFFLHTRNRDDFRIFFLKASYFPGQMCSSGKLGSE